MLAIANKEYSRSVEVGARRMTSEVKPGSVVSKCDEIMLLARE